MRFLATTFLTLMTAVTTANPFQPIHEIAVKDVARLARAISLVQPNRPEAKYVEYATGVYLASRRFGIEPAVLIAIAQQESSFRENLPEGRAGELGICQILKNWRNNAAFQAEFGLVSTKEFQDPIKSFLFAGWLLRTIKNGKVHGGLPYWSYYNARRFEKRFTYFLRVNKYLAVLKRYEHEFQGLSVGFMQGRQVAPTRINLASMATLSSASKKRSLASNAVEWAKKTPRKKGSEVASRSRAREVLSPYLAKIADIR